MKILALTAASLLLTACGASTPVKDTSIDLTGPQPANWQAKSKALIAEGLKDADSARYKFIGIEQENCRLYSMYRPDYRVWTAKIEVNAKNSFGAYTGYKLTRVHFAGGEARNTYRRSDKDGLVTFVPTCQGVSDYYRKMNK